MITSTVGTTGIQAHDIKVHQHFLSGKRNVFRRAQFINSFKDAVKPYNKSPSVEELEALVEKSRNDMSTVLHECGIMVEFDCENKIDWECPYLVDESLERQLKRIRACGEQDD